MNYEDAPKQTLFPKRRVRRSRIGWTCYFCQTAFPKGSAGWMQPFVEDGKFGSLRTCTANGDCMGYDRKGEFINAHIEGD